MADTLFWGINRLKGASCISGFVMENADKMERGISLFEEGDFEGPSRGDGAGASVCLAYRVPTW